MMTPMLNAVLGFNTVEETLEYMHDANDKDLNSQPVTRIIIKAYLKSAILPACSGVTVQDVIFQLETIRDAFP